MGTLPMIPDERLSTTAILADYLYPDNLFNSRLLDQELGGTALNDASDGLKVQVWTLRLEIDDDTTIGTFYISAANHAESVLFSGVGITEGSLAFDQNMNPFVAYAQAGEAKFWWYDSTVSAMVHSTLPAGTDPPKCCMDDKRARQLAANDIILCYTRSGNLYFRAQRDRYEDEYLLKEGVIGQVLKIAMNAVNRLQITVGEFE